MKMIFDITKVLVSHNKVNEFSGILNAGLAEFIVVCSNDHICSKVIIKDIELKSIGNRCNFFKRLYEVGNFDEFYQNRMLINILFENIFPIAYRIFKESFDRRK